MSLPARAAKLFRLLEQRQFRRTLLRHRVAATVEHVEAIAFLRPATLLDVGANKGQFATLVRGMIPKATIHAFEPAPEAAERFTRVFAGDSRTTLHRVALGAERGEATFYVTDRQDSSSLLPPGEGQRTAFGISTSHTITVPVRRLEEEVDLASLARPVLMKIDVQGAELAVLQGIRSLDGIDSIYVELSFVELYEGQALFADVCEHLAQRGFRLRGVFNQAFTTQFGPTQADCLFVR